jgi:3-hydroxyacyl-CoA dehydrogenase
MLHCAAVVASVESYIGLVEAGVGLLPGWGGTKEMALRASQALVPWKDFERRYKNLAMAQVATSGYEAKDMGFLKESDDVVMNDSNILFIAKEKAKFLSNNDYRAPIKPTNIKVFGDDGIAKVESLLVNMFEGHQISEHDRVIAQNIAYVMCGGSVTKGTVVSEDWLLHLEKEKFKQLAVTGKTEERIQHMLVNGKPLRN